MRATKKKILEWAQNNYEREFTLERHADGWFGNGYEKIKKTFRCKNITFDLTKMLFSFTIIEDTPRSGNVFIFRLHEVVEMNKDFLRLFGSYANGTVSSTFTFD